MYEEIKKQLKEILEIVKECPENLQEKCFELLLKPIVESKTITPDSQITEVKSPTNVKQIVFIIPIEVKAFLQQYSIPEDKLRKLFLLEGNQATETFSIVTSKRAAGQIQLALLISLKNALEGNKFNFSIEAVKQKCTDFKIYEAANFRKTFKDNKGLFKDLSDDAYIELTPDGKERLAETIFELSK